MGKNSIRLVFFINLLIVSSLFLVTSSLAAVLHWNPVESTSRCVIAGYKVHYGITSKSLTLVVDVGDVSSCDLDLLGLDPGRTYYFAVDAYSTTNVEGPLSVTIAYRDRPHIVEFPSIVFADSNIAVSTIDVTFNETNMQGADIKGNYTFSPTISFDSANGIVRTDRTYRLYMSYIPEGTILTMTVRNVTDNSGLALVSGSIVLNDDDKNGMADDWEAHYGVAQGVPDPDSDGLDNNSEFALGTSPVNADSDGDGMDDGWENSNDLNPLWANAYKDADGDGIGNLDEYQEGSSVSNRGPETPLLRLPENGDANIPLTPRLETNPYVDHETDGHGKTQWQISRDPTFTIGEDFVYDVETYDFLTRLTVPEFILDAGRSYFWRVRFFDMLNGPSLWSDPFFFTTVASNPEDSDGNGVPDIQQVIGRRIDLGNGNYLDESSTAYKIVTDGRVVLGLVASDNVRAVDCLKFIDPDDISDPLGKPGDLNFGLIQFRLTVETPGDTARVKVYSTEPAGPDWYAYDLINRWSAYSSEYPDHVLLGRDGTSVGLVLVDGGPGDNDGAANGIIVDLSGPGGSPIDSLYTDGTVNNDEAAPQSDDTPGVYGLGYTPEESGCFIATAAFGSPMEKHVLVLKEFRDGCLLKTRLGRSFVRAYYRYSPPMADVIARHALSRSAVRIGLIPVILFAWVVIHASPFTQTMIFLLVFSIVIPVVLCFIRYVFPGSRKPSRT